MNESLMELAYTLARQHYKAAARAVFSGLDSQFSSAGFDTVHRAGVRAMQLHIASLALAEKVWAGQMPYEKSQSALVTQFKDFPEAVCIRAFSNAYTESADELQRAILIYLDAGPNGGVYPIGMEEQLRAEYGPRTDVILDKVRRSLSILDEYEPDWSVDTLQSAARKVEEDLARRLPNFSAFLHKAMANYWSYGWR